MRGLSRAINFFQDLRIPATATSPRTQNHTQQQPLPQQQLSQQQQQQFGASSRHNSNGIARYDGPSRHKDFPNRDNHRSSGSNHGRGGAPASNTRNSFSGPRSQFERQQRPAAAQAQAASPNVTREVASDAPVIAAPPIRSENATANVASTPSPSPVASDETPAVSSIVSSPVSTVVVQDGASAAAAVSGETKSKARPRAKKVVSDSLVVDVAGDEKGEKAKKSRRRKAEAPAPPSDNNVSAEASEPVIKVAKKRSPAKKSKPEVEKS
jgi:hypothetical protein